MSEEERRQRELNEASRRDPERQEVARRDLEEQLAHAWADAQAIADGDTASGNWDEISAAAERAANRTIWRHDLARALANVCAGRFLFWSAVKKILRERYGPKRRKR